MATKSQRQVAAERVVRLCEKLMTTDPVFNVKTNPSSGVEYVYEPAADQVKTYRCPINVYREQLADGPADLKEQAVQLPRDVEQVRNFQKNQKRKIALTQDTNYNLQEIADDTKFIKEIITYPDVAIYMFHPQLWELFKGLLNRKDLPFIITTKCLQLLPAGIQHNRDRPNIAGLGMCRTPSTKRAFLKTMPPLHP
ncbi:hypothetical protein DAPPUDRAFT_103872 [Daphnia pulex]|uniref:Uncharacterized protein n=1 Tax=Daphnia pulex TaxID=6669 RepID=E9GKM1_DAPPU|nr:hypothetical protein DAPPUDRAFT_103872 [Daphnia pulex]|eukprot:EFX80038.1 hypothetical protein DAPPUDRAFT_103872 [Daphnia pulex]